MGTTDTIPVRGSRLDFIMMSLPPLSDLREQEAVEDSDDQISQNVIQDLHLTSQVADQTLTTQDLDWLAQ
jgi:hypothetical protein